MTMKQRYFLFFSLLLFMSSLRSQSLYFPPLTGNVWDSILPSNIGYCQPRIDSLYNYLQSKDTKSFIILKDGKRVLEKYFGTYTRDSVWYWASASKSLASFITGMAQQQGFININTKASQYLGAGWTSAPPAKEDLITVKNLLSMTSGLDDVPPSGCTNEDTAKACLVYKADASTRWAYHTGAYRKVQDVVSNAVGQNYNAITNNWIKTRTGMGGLWVQQVYYSKARDMARFGLLALNKGIWSQDTLIKDSVYFKAMVNSSQSLNQAYGYLWWLNGKSSFMTPQVQFVFTGSLIPNAPSNMFCALGKNDQKIYVVPGQNLVIVRQGNTAGGFNLASSAFDNTIWDYINKLTCPVSVNELESSADMVVYPNPANSFISVESAGIVISKVRIYNLYGSLVSVPKNDTEKGTSLDLSALPTGVYTIELESENHVISHKKIIKE
jgi:CubicO group peptidase (beta-lactamase class C family)